MTAPVELIETLEVRLRASGERAVINAADFSDALHERIAETAPAAAVSDGEAAPETAPAAEGARKKRARE